MTFPEIWHWLTTSRYTRRIEQENSELRAQLAELAKENHALIFALGKPRAIDAIAYESPDMGSAQATPLLRRRRPGKFQGFSQIKKQLENQEAPTKGA